VREEVVALENHSDTRARRGDIALRHAQAPARSRVEAIADRLAVDRDRPAFVLFE